jgi:O-antigen/teichoic acid export membrane protein
MNLAQGAARGAAWNFATVLFERSFGFVILCVLLRRIPADVVGLVAIGSAISDLARLVAVSGAGEQVQAFSGDRQVEAGAFWSQALLAGFLMLALCAAAPWVAAIYHESQLVLVLRMLALNIFLNSFLVVPSARLAVKFQFRTLGLLSLGSTVCGGVVALPLAFAGQSIAALVFQRMTGVVFYGVFSAYFAKWVPPPLPGWLVLKRSFGFSIPLMQAALVDYMSLSGYVMLVGLRVSIADLGCFRLAQRLAEVLQEVAFLPANKVLLPVFVAVKHDPARRFEATRQMLDLLSMAIFFAACISGAAARPLVALMFGPSWAQAAPVFAVLTLMVPVTALYGVINPLLTAAGRTHLVSLFAWTNAATMLLAVWFAAPYGLVVLAWSLAVRGLLGLVLVMAALKIGLRQSILPFLNLLFLPLLALAAGRLASAIVVSALPGISPLTELATSLGVSGGVFGAVVLLAAPERMRAMAARLYHALLGRIPV